MKPIYLDNNATTICAPEVVQAMIPFFGETFGNPSSAHAMGREAGAAVERARQQVAALICCDASELVFTAGATESNNLVLHGVRHVNAKRRCIVTTEIEHKSVLGPCQQLEEAGIPVVKVPVDSEGLVDIEAAGRLISGSTLVVSIQVGNNETGVLQPIRELAAIAHESGAQIHADAAQAVGKVPFDVQDLRLDYASFSAHKLYGPKGIGALYIRGGPSSGRLVPVFSGGGQEGGIRPGTHNVPAIVGMGEACRLAKLAMSQDEEHAISRLRDRLEELLLELVPDVRINGSRNARLPGTVNLMIPGVPADVLIANVPKVCFSSGSACASGTVSPSHVLRAMGLSSEDANCSVRFAVGRYNTLEQVQAAAYMVTEAVVSIRDRLAHG